MKIFLLILSALTLTVCSTHHLHAGSSEKVSRYGKDVSVKVTGANADIVDKLWRHIQANLLSQGLI